MMEYRIAGTLFISQTAGCDANNGLYRADRGSGCGPVRSLEKALQLVVQILGTIASLFMIEGLITAFSNATMGQGVAIVSLILLAFAAAFFCVGFIFYFTMLGIVERKLNLP